MILISIVFVVSQRDFSDIKRAAFVEAARLAFFAHGYGATAMSSIAAHVGGSKTTLWNHFPSKEALFTAVVDDLVERFGAALEVPLDHAAAPEAALRQFGHGMMGIILSQPIVDLNRLVAGEAGRFPELGILFYERGPKRGKDKLASYLAAAMGDGRLRQGDPALAARQFAALCQAGIHQLRMLGLPHIPDAPAVDADIEAAIDTFLRAWAV